MKKEISLIILTASLAGTGIVNAQTEEEGFSANISIATDYLFRGISQTDNNPAIQGGFDYAHESGIYVGTWASNVDFAGSTEFDFYGGFAGELNNGLAWDLGAIYYAYPGSDSVLDEEYVEVFASLSYDFDSFNVGGGFAYSPDYFLESDDGLYSFGDVGVPLPNDFVLSSHIGHQSIENNINFGAPDYTDWNIGLSRQFDRFTLGLSYSDTDLDESECFSGADICDGTFMFSITGEF